MSLHPSPEHQAANGPDTWLVTKATPKLWRLTFADGTVLDSFGTKTAAEKARTVGFVAKQHDWEGKWFAGWTPTGWKPYVQVKAEQDANAARWAAA